MGLSYDYASSILLCAEDDNCILCFEEEGEEEEEKEEEEEEAKGWVLKENKTELYESFSMGFPFQNEDWLESITRKEVDFLPRVDYPNRLTCDSLDLSIRRNAIDWIWKVHAHYNFGPLSAYLSINYLDRFLSEYKISEGEAWTGQLLSVACLSLAAKLEETEVPLSLDLQVGDAKYVFEPVTIQRMELLVLSTLKWRMQAVTPFSYLDYFLIKFNDGTLPTKLMLSFSIKLILRTVREIDFIGYKPSEIASAIAMLALEEAKVVDVEKTMAYCNHVNKERVLRCYEQVGELIITMQNETSKDANDTQVSYVPESPNRVLDVSCLSYKSEDTSINSQDDSQHNSPPSKKRKISNLYVT